MGIHPFVRQSKLESCLHRLALSEWVRGGLILIVPSQLIVCRSISCFELAITIMQAMAALHHVFAVQKDEFTKTQRCQKLVYCA